MFNWKHRKIKSLLPLYGDKSLSPKERKAIEEHLQVCDECRAEWESLRWAISLVKEAPRVPAPRPFVVRAADLERTSVRTGFYVARAFTALATAAFILLLGFDLLTTALGKAPAPMVATAPEVIPTLTPALEPSPQLDAVRSLPMIPYATGEKEVDITEETEALIFKSPLLTPEPSPQLAEIPTPTPTPTPAPLPGRKLGFALRWLPLEIAVGVSALAGGVISWILRRRK